MIDDYVIVKALCKIKEIICIEKFVDTKILIDTDDINWHMMNCQTILL